jgi:hypothetical protein
MKGSVAVLFVTLNARAHIALAANVALESPASSVDILDADDGLEKDLNLIFNLIFGGRPINFCCVFLV